VIDHEDEIALVANYRLHTPGLLRDTTPEHMIAVSINRIQRAHYPSRLRWASNQ
jgi:hypothetical protein